MDFGYVRVSTKEQNPARQVKILLDMGIEMVTPAYRQFKSWAEEFDSATHEQKKMIACQLLRRIEVGRGYKISVELNMTYRQFCTEWNTENFLETPPAI